MNLKTNFNPSHEEQLKSLVGKDLRAIIFFQTKPNIFGGNFPSKEHAFTFYGERVALIFRMPPDNLENIPIRKRHKMPKQSHYKVFSIKCNDFNRDSHIMGNVGGPIWNLDFHFDTFTRRLNPVKNPLPEVIDDVELIKLLPNKKSVIQSSHTVFSNIRQGVRKIEIFGMKEYFESIESVDFESMPYPNHKAFENYEYPIDINITTGILISLSEGHYLLIKGGGDNGINFVFFDEQELQKKYQEMKEWKNIFNRPFHKLIYTTDA